MPHPTAYRSHWIALALVVAGSFAILGGLGPRIASGAPPVPTRVVRSDGHPLFDGDAIRRGQNVWQRFETPSSALLVL